MIYPDLDPVAVSLGPIAIHWYGISYLLAFLIGWRLAVYRADRLAGWDRQQVEDLIFYVVIGVVAGGRLGYILFYGFNDWLDDLLRFFRVWEGGMSFHGGLLGVLLAMGLLARKQKKHFFEITDFIAPIVPVGLLTGRLANFINGELWGGVTDLAWGMQLKCHDFAQLCYGRLGLPADTELSPPLHPSQLYEAALEGILLFVILWFFSRLQPPRMAVSGAFLVFYALFRSLVETVRMPDAHIGYLFDGWLTMGQLLSLPMFLLGLVLIIVAYRRSSISAKSGK